MSTRKYFKSFLSFSLGTWLRAFIYVFTTPIITYLINPEEFGKSAMYATAFGVINTIVLFGTDQSFVRFFYDYEEDKKNELLWSCLLPSVIIATILSMVVLVLSDRISVALYGQKYDFINLIFVVNIYLSLFQRYNQLIVRMLKKGMLYSLIDIVAAVSTTVFTIIFALFSRTFYSIILGGIVGTICALLVGISQGRNYWKITRPEKEDLKEVLKYSAPFVPTMLLFWLSSSIDRISLRQYSTFVQIGIYSAAFKVAQVLSLVQSGFTTFWVPMAYERYSKNNQDTSFFVRANEMVSFVMFSVGFLLLGFKDILFLLLARSYRESSMVFPFLSFLPIMYSISETTVVWINFKKKSYWHMLITTVSALTNYIGNTLLVPIYGARGAAISTGISYIVFFWMRTLVAMRLYPKAGYNLKKVTLVTILMVCVALIETFQNSFVLNMVMGILGVIITIFVYKEPFMIIKNELQDVLKSRL
ncbi:oligosaccharide flippase family protein [Fervidobacterium pennivorans]|uniref:oligosaccharide flippase family protein n=1 Tax=Fervidobacterium pennivorans TaxID=93466 RepID=UPI0014367559|nr:oligosaccharide flippase family protein [Fervidobacterium pennivorans]QIV77656.1 polysaccharide biosynthesis protein [Fervidobacterium pennivorans subsp. keratinolyticus]